MKLARASLGVRPLVTRMPLRRVRRMCSMKRKRVAASAVPALLPVRVDTSSWSALTTPMWAGVKGAASKPTTPVRMPCTKLESEVSVQTTTTGRWAAPTSLESASST